MPRKANKKAQAEVRLKPSDFVHLHLHSHYSLLDGLSKIPEIVGLVKEYGMESVALTDHGTLSGAVDFYQQCRKFEIKPIIGIEVYLAAASHLSKETVLDRNFTHLILLAQNQTGYRNLMQLATIAYVDGFYYRPRVDKELLEKHNEGIIVLSGCMGGEIASALANNQYDKAKEVALWYQGVFGDRFYLELQDHQQQSQQAKINQELMRLGEELAIELVVTSDSHYPKQEDQEAHEVLLCIQTRRFIDDDQRMSLKEWHLNISHPKDVIERWQNICPQAILNTKKIADQCQWDLQFDQILLPNFEPPKGFSPFRYLQRLVFEGLGKLYGDLTEEQISQMTPTKIKSKLDKNIVQRAEYELETIKAMNYSSYFLIVWDFCRWGKENKILFGPGRGSVGGSIVAYSLNITTIDPIQWDLLFERFLNPQRVSMPDIDIDIEDSRRDEVIQYVIDKYGSDRVASIVTFGTMAARNAIRDVARVLKMSYFEADQLAKMLPPPVFGRNVSLADALADDPKLKAKYNQDDFVKKVFDLAMRLEGTIRSHGVHAAGVVIAPGKMTDYVPLEINNKGVLLTQYDMDPIEKLGLLKMDFLGLSNLTIIRNTLRIIRKVYGQEIDIDNLDLDDRATYELLSNADTIGVFQLNSRGMRSYLQRLQPANFEDLAAILALYRPGPLTAGLIDDFIERRHGRQKISLPHPAFAKALENTYGVLVYQEQVIRISQDVCGFSGVEADDLRKAIGKKKRDLMMKYKKQFIERGIKQTQVPKAVMEKFWQDLLGFADYAFNRAHAVGYGVIAYQTAYLKAHYPAALMSAVMTSDAGNTDKLKIAIHECQQRGLEVLPPDVNQSFPEFAVIVDKQQDSIIRFGLESIKNVSSQAVHILVENRQESGPYLDFGDFLTRQHNNSYLNRKTLESLTKAGVFNSLIDQTQILSNLDYIVDFLSQCQRPAVSQQTSFLDVSQEFAQVSKLSLPNHNLMTISVDQKSDWERELLGIYISQHPLDIYQETFDNLNLTNMMDLVDNINGIVTDNARFKVGGLITNMKLTKSKASQAQMAVIEFEDKTTTLELVVFPAIFAKYQSCWQEGNVLTLTLRAQTTDSRGNTLLNTLWTIETAQVVASKQTKDMQVAVGKEPKH